MFKRISIETIMLAAAVLFLAPMILIVITAFKPESEILHFTGLLPSHWTLDHFLYVFTTPEDIPIFHWLFNSIFISSSTTLLVLVVDSLAAYALARLALPGAKILFAVIVATLMIPGQVLLVPVYLLLNQLGWLDTPLALIVPAGAGVFGVFLLHQFFKAVPRELEEAAALDGCSSLGIYWHVVLPLSKPAMATLGILTFIASWNDFLGPLVFLDSVDQYTLPVGIALFQGSYTIEYGLTLAASVICTVPLLIVFLILHRQIIEAMSMVGIKE